MSANQAGRVSPVDMPWTALPSHHCFGCSPENPTGLKLRFGWRSDGGLATTFRLGREHESYPGIVHGGLVGVVCDETMGNLILLRTGRWALTTSMRLRYISPLIVGDEYTCVATVVDSVAGDLCRVSSEILDRAGEAMATATATYRPVDIEEK